MFVKVRTSDVNIFPASALSSMILFPKWLPISRYPLALEKYVFGLSSLLWLLT